MTPDRSLLARRAPRPWPPLLRALTLPLAWLLALGCPGLALAQGAVDVDLAVRASEVHALDCAKAQGVDIAAAVEGLGKVASVWAELDAALQGSETPQPYLLYWRGLLAQCLGRDGEAVSDLQGFLQAAEFLGAVDDDRQSGLAGMTKDAQRRVRQLNRRAAGAGTSISGPVSTRRGAGAGLLIGGGGAAVAGFAVNLGTYARFFKPETEQVPYEDARRVGTGGLVIGVAGASFGVVGLFVLILPAAKRGPVSLIPGPVPTLALRF